MYAVSARQQQQRPVDGTGRNGYCAAQFERIAQSEHTRGEIIKVCGLPWSGYRSVCCITSARARWADDEAETKRLYATYLMHLQVSRYAILIT